MCSTGDKCAWQKDNIMKSILKRKFAKEYQGTFKLLAVGAGVEAVDLYEQTVLLCVWIMHMSMMDMGSTS